VGPAGQRISADVANWATQEVMATWAELANEAHVSFLPLFFFLSILFSSFSNFDFHFESIFV
jgi:hypothetical protein